MADTYKFRIDHHGSLIRPPELLNARRQRSDGEIDDAALRSVEDQAIAEAVRTQRRLSLSVVTDGQFRREDFRSAVFDAVDGFRRAGGDSRRAGGGSGQVGGDSGRAGGGSRQAGGGSGQVGGDSRQVGDDFRRAGGDEDGLARWVAADELKPRRTLVADDTAAIAAQTRVPAKATLPSPAYLAARCFDAGGPFRTARELGEALARIVNDEIEVLIARGVRYVQLDNPAYAGFLSGEPVGALSLADAIAVDSLAVGLETKPDDVRIGLCPAHSATGTVDAAMAERIFSEVPVDRWILPYCAGTVGEAQLLRAVPADRDVCLGIVDPAVAALEDVDTIMARLDAAASIKDVADLAVSPSGGFSEVAGRAAISAADQWRKLTHVETIARMTWGNEL